jgi:predicted GNAT family N-acyltransferase
VIVFREVVHGSPDYAQTVQLRREVLRWPLGLDLTEEDLALESGDIHLAGFEGDRVVACLVLVPLSDGEVKMRQVAVLAERRGQGIGRRVVEASERLAVERAFSQMTLHARDTAVPFYLALGYETVGEPFEEVTIPHQAMRKLLLAQS